MVLALLLPRCIRSLVGRAPGPIFFRVGPHGKLQARKLSSLTGLKLWDIMGFKKRKEKMQKYTLAQILEAWTAAYGEDMQEEYPGFIQRLSEEVKEDVEKRS